MIQKTNKYKRGFREGFNNPSQYGEKILNIKYPDDYVFGIIAGKGKKFLFQSKGENPFIWNDEDLKKYMEA